MSHKENSQLLRNSTNFFQPQHSPRGEGSVLIKKTNYSSDYDDSSPCFGNKERRKPDMNKNEEEENRSFFNAAKEANSNNDHTSNNIFEIYEKKQTQDSLMDKINKEINDISNITNSKYQAFNGNDSAFNNENINQNNSNYEACNNEVSTKTELDINKNNVCDLNCKCATCNSKHPDNITNQNIHNKNFVEYKTVSFKNPDQLDIVVEKDNKQACCLIYNNNCIIF